MTGYIMQHAAAKVRSSDFTEQRDRAEKQQTPMERLSHFIQQSNAAEQNQMLILQRDKEGETAFGFGCFAVVPSFSNKTLNTMTMPVFKSAFPTSL